MKKLALAALAATSCVCAAAHEEPADSIRVVDIEEIRVTSTRATETTPVAHTDMNREALAERNFGQDMPYLLTSTPSVVTTSDAGTGIGYTGIRIRGTDATRINVTANGVPMNDAESHSLFWVNTPDLASSVEDIQIQRGAGSSTNGAGAFGGSINIRTDALSAEPFAELSAGGGSFGTHKETVRLGTGLLGGHWITSLRLSNLHSDGFIRRASADLKSFFFQTGFFSGNTALKLIVFGGKEKTYHAWNGVDMYMIETDRRYNSCGEIEDDEGNVTGYYRNQTDNYLQTNYQLHFTQVFSQRWNLNVSLHFTDGEGYYEEYKNGRRLAEYGLQPFMLDTVLVTKSNLVRQKRMDNWFGGGVFSLNYRSERLDMSLGGAANRYDGSHVGRVVWVKNYIGDLDPDHEYYRNRGVKDDANIYWRASVRVARGLNIYADMQYRYIHYTIHGPSDKWDYNAGRLQQLDVNNRYHFFNPKAGVYWNFGRHHGVYGSFSVAHKEPTRNNYTDAKFGAVPKPERLLDYEAGYAFRNRWLTAGANFYYMQYKNQLVLTGELNEIGEALADNVPDSYRMGVELTAGIRFHRNLRWDLNATFSRNRIRNYVEYIYHSDENYDQLYNPDGSPARTVEERGDTPLSFSPSVTAGSLLAWDDGHWSASLQSLYVGEQYLTNAGRRSLMLDEYFINNLYISYTFKFRSVKSLRLALAVNNLFDVRYESNGFGSTSCIVSPDGSSRIEDYAGYYPQAGINFMASVTVRF